MSLRWSLRFASMVGFVCLFLSLVPQTAGNEERGGTAAQPVLAGQRVFTCGHSFHVFMPGTLGEVAKSAGVKDHVQIGMSSIGGSRVIQHWEVAEEKNKAKEALRSGKVDVLTLSPIYPPDEGIESFVKLAVEHNPKIRVFVQINWLPFDLYDTTFKIRPKTVDHNAQTSASLQKLHAPYFKSLEDVVADLNKQYSKSGKPVAFAAPVGQAVVALRQKIIDGKAPGLKVQEDLFTDAIGHAKAPIVALSGYCYYALIYQTSPVGLPMPSALKKANNPEFAKLNTLLQEIAWETVTKHPQSGVAK